MLLIPPCFWNYIFLSYIQIDFDKRLELPIAPNMFAYIDSTSCQIERPSDKLIQGELYDGKHKFHSLKYECCVRSDGLFVWRSSPFPGKMHDIRVFNESGLLDKIRAGEMLIGGQRVCWPRVYHHSIQRQEYFWRWETFQSSYWKCSSNHRTFFWKAQNFQHTESSFQKQLRWSSALFWDMC